MSLAPLQGHSGRRNPAGLPLSLLHEGEVATILEGSALDPDLERHLAAMGLRRDATVEVVGNENGRVTLSVGDSRIGIDADLARRIRVLPHKVAEPRLRARRRRGGSGGPCCR